MKKILFFMLIISLLLSSCKSFKRVNLEGQPDECKDFYLVMEYYSVQGGDSAFIGTVYEKCVQARRDAKSEKAINCYKLNPENNLDGFVRCMK